MGKKVLVTGAAGFIGMHTAIALAQKGYTVVGCDNFNNYYDVSLKSARADHVSSYGAEVYELDLVDSSEIREFIHEVQPDIICHLAAQAGVRHSFIDPQSYIDSNITGTLNVLEAMRYGSCKNLVFASSSSVYGGVTASQFREDMPLGTPVSLYAATKIHNEHQAALYSRLFHLHTVGLRFFTVYGPWGRPDMAAWLFTDALLEGKPLKVFGNGDMGRDMTYVDDIVSGICSAVHSVDSFSDPMVFNLGNDSPVPLRDLISTIECAVGITGIKKYEDMQPGDFRYTHADISLAREKFGYSPSVPVAEGIRRFVSWYRDFYQK